MKNSTEIPSICSPKEIQQLNESKEYTLLCSPLLRQILLSLSDANFKLWLLLYDSAKFDDQLEITTSYEEIALQLKKSTRSIQRQVSDLCGLGYLTIKQNNSKKGRQLCNTFCLHIPNALSETLKTKKNRLKIVKSHSPTLQLKQNQNDNFDDKNVIPINTTIHTIKIDKENNNNSIINSVDQFPSAVVIKNLDELKRIKIILEEKKKALANKQEFYEDYQKQLTQTPTAIEVVKQFQQISAQYHSLEFEYQQLQDKYQNLNQKTSWLSCIETDATYIANQKGNRVVDQLTLHRIEKILTSKYSDKPTINRLTNEIVFAVRFDSLVKQRESGAELSIPHAVNIALKKIAQQEWTTPQKFQNFGIYL